jgi:hypothetical protein
VEDDRLKTEEMARMTHLLICVPQSYIIIFSCMCVFVYSCINCLYAHALTIFIKVAR